MSLPFCGHCSRIRITSDGKIRTCLFSQTDHDLYSVMKRGGSDDDLAAYIRKTVDQKEARHHIGEPGFQKPSRSMVHIGEGDRGTNNYETHMGHCDKIFMNVQVIKESKNSSIFNAGNCLRDWKWLCSWQLHCHS